MTRLAWVRSACIEHFTVRQRVVIIIYTKWHHDRRREHKIWTDIDKKQTDTQTDSEKTNRQ